MKKVILTHRYSEEAISLLRREFQLHIAADQGPDIPGFLRRHADADGLISFLSDPIDGAVIKGLKKLKIIANFAVGYNNIDIGSALENNVLVTHTPDVLTEATADLTMALILAVARRLVEGDAFVRTGRFTGWGANLFLGKELRGAILGIIGMGRIGLATALRARAFGMKVVYYSRSAKPALEKKYGFARVTFLELIRSADIVSLHLPYSPGVHHLFNQDVFALMKKDAIFINAARGPLMDEEALAEKLAKNERFGAGLDVYEGEPAVNKKLKHLKNTVLLPHLGSATGKTRRSMAMMTVQAVRQALNGEKPRHLIPEWKERLRKKP
ncbi:MAG TPA: D-glycerate dehydrogenase [Patescibacteria group bacterium]|nr:D-glycerate dehydrogenase [Patescibacteria group bacterium]